jgi:hypothetical protein
MLTGKSLIDGQRAGSEAVVASADLGGFEDAQASLTPRAKRARLRPHHR